VISLLSTSYAILSNILLSRLGAYIDEIIGDHQFGFRRNRSTTGHIFCIRQILEKNWDYSKTLHQLFIDLKAYDSVRREVLYNILLRVWEGSIVQYSHRVWGTHETSQAD
jgi:hypothetical protein